MRNCDPSQIGIVLSGVVLNVSGMGQLINVNTSGFINTWSGLRIKIDQERSGFQNTWSGLRQKIIIERSGLRNIDAGIIQEQFIKRSGFHGTWSGLERIEAELIRKYGLEFSGFQNIWSGLRRKIDIERSGFTMIAPGADTMILADRQNISGVAVSGYFPNCFDRWTLYLDTSGAMNITLELCPNDVAPFFWFEPAESPIAFATSGSTVIEMGYDTVWIRLTSDSGSGVTAVVRGCY